MPLRGDGVVDGCGGQTGFAQTGVGWRCGGGLLEAGSGGEKRRGSCKQSGVSEVAGVQALAQPVRQELFGSSRSCPA